MAVLYILRPPVNVLRHILDFLSGQFHTLIPVYVTFRHLGASLQALVTSGMLKSAEKAAMDQSHDTDSRALAWTYDSLDEDHELEQFLAGVLGLLNSRTVKQPAVVLARVDTLSHRDGLISGALGLVSRPIGPSLSPQAAQHRRFKICSEAIFALLPHGFRPWCSEWLERIRQLEWFEWFERLERLEWARQFRGAESDLLLTLERMAKDSDQDLAVAAKCMAHGFFCASHGNLGPQR
ncbi:hypothetical protein BC834DRAFT_888584 [Gloeopeniophorella convolvens]|nr:hypothetical protein BC834DRAFT_888584 [Gloeopeniophorella convolvens]